MQNPNRIHVITAEKALKSVYDAVNDEAIADMLSDLRHLVRCKASGLRQARPPRLPQLRQRNGRWGMTYEVQHNTAAGWVNTWSYAGDDGQMAPETFPTPEEAQAALDEFFDDIRHEIDAGDSPA